MDTDLVVRAQAGDHQAFARLATDSASRFHAVAYNIVRDPELAKDATQQALLAMWQSLPKLRDPARFEAWAYRTVVRACYAETRRSKRFLAALGSLTSHHDDSTDPIREIEERDQFDRALSQLSMEHRAVLVLRFHLDMKIDDIAATLEIPVGTARSRLDRAIKKIRPALAADLPIGNQAVREEMNR